MENSTRNMIIGLVVAGLLASLVCCVGGVAFYMVARTSVGEHEQVQPKRSAPSLNSEEPDDEIAAYFKEVDLRAFWQQARADKWSLPAEPRLGPMKQEEEDRFLREVTFVWNKDDRPPKVFGVSPKASAYLSLAMLAGGKIDEFHRLMQATENKTTFLASLAYHGSCGPIIYPTEEKFTSTSKEGVVYHYGYRTEYDCHLRTEIRAATVGKNVFYVPTKFRMTSKKFPIFITRIQDVAHTKSREIYKRYGDETPDKIYKARRAGMKADQFFSEKLIGNDAAIRAVVPKAKLVGKPTIRTIQMEEFPFGIHEYLLDLEGERFRYRVLWVTLSIFTKRAADKEVFVIVGEDLVHGG